MSLCKVGHCNVLEETTSKELKGFLDLFRIPGCVYMFLHCTLIEFCGSARTTGIGGWITSSVCITEHIYVYKSIAFANGGWAPIKQFFMYVNVVCVRICCLVYVHKNILLLLLL